MEENKHLNTLRFKIKPSERIKSKSEMNNPFIKVTPPAKMIKLMIRGWSPRKI